jgi:hypothetical protein
MKFQFGIRGLLILIALLALASYGIFKFKQYKSFGTIPSQCYAVQIGTGPREVLFRIAAKDVAIHRVRIVLHSNIAPKTILDEEVLYDGIDLASIRVVQSTSVSDVHGPGVIILPPTIRGNQYNLVTQQKELELLGWQARFAGVGRYQFQDEFLQLYELFIFIE